jgi:hypothetical protein
LDFDDTLTLDDAIGIFKDYLCIIATTENHRKRKNGVLADRFRVVIPWARCIDTRADYVHNMTLAIKEYEADQACKDAGRLFKPSREIAFIGEGDLREVVAPPAKAVLPPVACYGERPAWLISLIARGSDGEAGRNIAAFKIAMACLKCGLSIGEIIGELRGAYGVNTLDDSELVAVIKSATKKFAASTYREEAANQT